MKFVTTGWLFGLAFAPTALAVTAESFRSWDEVPHVVVDDSVKLTAAAADRMAKRLGMTPKGASRETETARQLKWVVKNTSALDEISREMAESYTPREIYLGRYSFWNGLTPSAAFFLSRPPVDDSTFPVWPAKDGRSRYGFTTTAGAPDLTEFLDKPKRNDNLDRILLSAYRQEVDPVYADTLTDFRIYQPLSESAFERRLWLAAGYGMQYAYTDNLVTGKGTTLIAGTYLMDAATLFIMAGGAFRGNTAAQKAAIVAAGALLNVYFKVTIGAVGRGAVKAHNKVVKSGYKIPPLEPRRQSRAPEGDQGGD